MNGTVLRWPAWCPLIGGLAWLVRWGAGVHCVQCGALMPAEMMVGGANR